MTCQFLKLLLVPAEIYVFHLFLPTTPPHQQTGYHLKPSADCVIPINNVEFLLNMIPDLYLIYASLALLILAIGWLVRFEIKFRRLLGKGNESLDSAVAEIRKEMSANAKYRDSSEKYLESVEQRLRKSIVGVETVRFNPFKGNGSGGNQSFSTAFVNEQGDGVVISSLYSREHVSIFAKPIKKMSSEYEMTAEEKESLRKASEVAQN